jgi:hypothetical protein
MSVKGDMNVMQQDLWRPTPSLSGRRTGAWVLAVLVTLAGGGKTGTSAQSPGPPVLSGWWTLQESTGDLPDQAVRAFDGSAVSSATIEIEEAGGSVTVRRITPNAVVLRVMLLQAGDRDAAAVRGAVLTARAEWQSRTLAARGEVTIKQGFLKRRVAYEEEWRVSEGERTLRVMLSVKTPFGVKRRTQVFVRDESHDLNGGRAASQGAVGGSKKFGVEVNVCSHSMRRDDGIGESI